MKTNPPVCVLVGPPGAGKTTVGRLAAAALGVPFRDTDGDVAVSAGKTIPEIFFEDGEQAFRLLERHAVVEALSVPSGIVALGSGSVLNPEVQSLLAKHTVLFLSARLATVVRRTSFRSGGQIAMIGTRNMIKAMLDERAELYRRLASVTIATDDREPDEIAVEVGAVYAALRGSA